ncbi:MAG: Hsp20/alpha crystallin family protein [Oscillatoriales cyanobacterium SM2_1_8]|nr:Hsp20/alpha crystallin family protein [Oscillatoriales cyanobacterium SM2_1_8]
MLVRLQPFQELESVRRQFDRFFEDALGTAELTRGEWMPAAELHDHGDALSLRLALPGIDPAALDIQVTKDAVRIAGERRSQKSETKEGAVWSEVRYGKFSRAIALPVEVQNERTAADYRDGFLTLTLPKAAAAKSFKVTLNPAATAHGQTVAETSAQ